MREKEMKKGKEMNERNRGFLKGFVGAAIVAIIIASAFAIAPVVSSTVCNNVSQSKAPQIEKVESDQMPRTNILCRIEISGQGSITPRDPSDREPLLTWVVESADITIRGLLGNTNTNGDSIGEAIFFMGQATDDPTVEINGFALIAFYTTS